MKKVFCCIGVVSLLVQPAAFAAPRTIPLNHMADQSPAAGVEKPQMARDLEGLDPREGGISKGLRGSFTVRHYVSGPWKGGTAVIELASDSSYAEIRIFDRDGNLQRIYSVQPRSQNTQISASKIENPIEMVNQGNPNQPARESREAMNVQRSPEREAAVQQQTAQAMQGGREGAGGSEEANGRVRPGTVSSRSGDIREGTSAEEAAPAAGTSAGQASPSSQASAQAAAPKRHVIRVRHKRHHKKSTSSLDTPLSGEAPPAEDEYYYEDVVVIDKPVESRETAEKPIQVAKAEPASPPVPPPSASAKSSASKSKSSASNNTSDSARDLEHTAARTSGSIPVSAGAAASASSGRSAAASSAYDESNLPDVTQAVKENESETAPSGASSGKRKMESDSWKPKPAPPPTQVVSLPGTAVEMPPPSARVQKSAPPEEDLTAAKAAAAKLESDNWTPKPSAAAPSDAALGLTTPAGTTSRYSKKSKQGGMNEDMVPMSDQVKSGGQVNEGSAGWSPTPAAKLNPKEEQTLAMINSLKAVQPQAPVTKVNRDINNPEEGVKPFYSLEKYSGAQFGRHREFERRVMYKQNGNTSVKGYDFFIDEVDRKQEKHYLYYYKIDSKTKKAKLIATEKHEHVTFLGNYDIGTEDKGKISKE